MPNLSLNIDIVPVLLLLAALFSAACLMLPAFFRSVPNHLRLWALGGLCIALAVLGIVLRGAISDHLSILAANISIMAGYGFLGAGASLYFGRSPRRDVLLQAGFALAFAIAYATDADLASRVTIVSAAMGIHAALILRPFLRVPASLGVIGARIMLSGTIVLAVARAAASNGLLRFAEDIALLNGLALVGGIVGALCIAIALLVLNVPMLRRQDAALATASDANPPPSASGWRLARSQCALVTPSGQELRLTGNEFLLLQQLGGRDAQVERRALNAVIGRNADDPKDRGVDVLISRLRRKCADAGVELPITSVRGRGYVFHGELMLA